MREGGTSQPGKKKKRGFLPHEKRSTGGFWGGLVVGWKTERICKVGKRKRKIGGPGEMGIVERPGQPG